MLIDNLNLHTGALETVEDAENLLNTRELTKTELTFLISYLTNQKSYNQSFQTIVTHPKQASTIDDRMLAYLADQLHTAHKKYSTRTAPAYTALLTQLYLHPKSGPATTKAFHEAIRKSISGWLHLRTSEENLSKHLITQNPYTKKITHLTTQSYCTAGVAAHIAVAATHQNQPEEADKALTRAFHHLTTTNYDFPTYMKHEKARRARTYTENENQSLQKALRVTATHLTHSPDLHSRDTTQTLLIRAHAISAVLSSWAQHLTLPAIHTTNPTNQTATQIAEELDLNHLQPEHLTALSNSPELPTEYQKELIKIELQQTVQNEYLNRLT